jgi:uncharacterized membrane protein
MQSAVVGVFHDARSAEAALREMLEADFSVGDISVIGRDEITRGKFVDAERREPGGSTAAVGMATGAVAGGLGGLLVGLGLLTIPGIGPVLAAGPLASAIAGAGLGAVGGALVGALVDLGVPEDEAPELAEAVRRGAILLAVRASDDMIDRAVGIMERSGAMDVAENVEPAGRPRRRVRVYRVEVRRRIA